MMFSSTVEFTGTADLIVKLLSSKSLNFGVRRLDLSRSRDVIGHVTIRFPTPHSYTRYHGFENRSIWTYLTYISKPLLAVSAAKQILKK